MSTIKKLQIRGIRSFGIESGEVQVLLSLTIAECGSCIRFM